MRRRSGLAQGEARGPSEQTPTVNRRLSNGVSFDPRLAAETITARLRIAPRFDEPAIRPFESLGRYKVVRLLGKPMGRVFCSRPRWIRDVAVKLLREDLGRERHGKLSRSQRPSEGVGARQSPEHRRAARHGTIPSSGCSWCSRKSRGDAQGSAPRGPLVESTAKIARVSVTRGPPPTARSLAAT